MAQILQHYLKMNSNTVRKKMGMVFQYSALLTLCRWGKRSLWSTSTYGLREDEIKRIVAERLDWVGLKGYESYMPK